MKNPFALWRSFFFSLTSSFLIVSFFAIPGIGELISASPNFPIAKNEGNCVGISMLSTYLAVICGAVNLAIFRQLEESKSPQSAVGFEKIGRAMAGVALFVALIFVFSNLEFLLDRFGHYFISL